jgi:PPE-repeat protein
MWIQAATTMTTYQAVSSAAVAATPSTTPAPQIQKASTDSSSGDDSGIIDNDGGDPTQPSWWVNRVTEITDTLGRDFAEFPSNPSAAISQLLSDIPALIADEIGHLGEVITTFQPELTAAAVALATTTAGAAGGFAGMTGLAGIQAATPAAAPALAPVASAPSVLPAAGMSPPIAMTVSAPATAPAPAPAPTAATVAGPAPAAPPAASVAGFVPPYAVGPPGIGFGAGMSTSAASSAKRKAPAPDSAAAAAAAAAREAARARRRRRTGLRGYGDEFMDMNIEVDPDWGAPRGEEPVASTVASDRGAGPLGFAGTVSKGSARAAGLSTLAGDEFGGGPTVPMVPGTWDPEASEGEGGDCS